MGNHSNEQHAAPDQLLSDTLTLMSRDFAKHLAANGPESCEQMDTPTARQWAARQARGHYENFSVLSRMVPAHLRDDFAAIYAFCRWSDDLADEVGDSQESLSLLDWWRSELQRCFDGSPRHPVFVALQPTLETHDLPLEPFEKLISAFEQDQKKTRYESWQELLNYCEGSANPVGRLVLMVCGQPRMEEYFTRSDAVCTALQLTNHWQDIGRDKLERDRIYIPRELNPIEDFESRLQKSARQGHGIDHTFLSESREVIRQCVDKTWPIFAKGEELLPLLDQSTRPIVWLFIAGGEHLLRQIEMWNYETALHRPTVGRATKLMLVAKAWLKTRASRNSSKDSAA